MRFLVLLFIFFYSCNNEAKTSSIKNISQKDSTFTYYSPKNLCSKVIGVINPQTLLNENYVFDTDLHILKVDTLPQVKFWRSIMNLHQDSALLNIGNSRYILQKTCTKTWELKNDSTKSCFKDSVRTAKQLDTTQKILLTTGKKFFYDFNKTSQNFNKGIHCFIENNVDPWYAQAILLIESPNKLQKSNAGAYGSFQLMKDVARLFGLKVNANIDERADFERSAYAASSLIKKICIPKVHQLLDTLKITNHNENELWFKLLVMHVYHAGSYNVEKALFTFTPAEGNIQLIYNLWHAKTNRFKSASQNYSQLILAAMLEMNERYKLAPKNK